MVNNSVIHTPRYYSISTGVTVDTDKQVAVVDRSNEVLSPSISGTVIAYIAASKLGMLLELNAGSQRRSTCG